MDIILTFAIVLIVLIVTYLVGYHNGYRDGSDTGVEEITIDEGLGSVLRWVNSNDLLPQDEDDGLVSIDLHDENDSLDHIFVHECIGPGCVTLVEYDDEPWCFSCSPDEGSSVRGYSARREAASHDSIEF